MFPLPEMIIAVLAQFAGLFSAPVRGHAQVLVIGAILCQGPRTVAAILRVMGLGQDPRFERYHRVLSRARWSGLQAARILLGLLIRLLPPQWVPLVVVDDTRLSRIFPLTKLLDEVLVLLETVGFIQEGAHDLHHTATVYQGVYRPA